ncbi:MAG: hypothetical protein ACO25B_04590 [Chitinophagaceae bacterium]
MKKVLLFAFAILLSAALMAQGNSGNKGKSKDKIPAANTGKDKDKDEMGKDNKGKDNKGKDDESGWNDHDRKVWDGVGDKSCTLPSKNQPAKVRQAFQRDYPNALNVRWTKCRGDWTATFSGGLFRSTAVYHANGDRRDTRTPVSRDNVAREILDGILKREPRNPLDDAIRIEVPNAVREIFRIKSILDGQSRFEFYNSDGIRVDYSY